MSHNKVKNISIKKDKVTITTAESNLHPITYRTFEWEWATKALAEHGRGYVIGNIIYDFACGNFKSTNDYACRKFLYALTINRDKTTPLYDIIWNSYDFETKTERYTAEQRQQAKDELIKIYYQNYLIGEQLDKENAGNEFLINMNCGYFYKKTQYGFKYAFTKQYGARLNRLIADILVSNGTISAEYNPQVIPA